MVDNMISSAHPLLPPRKRTSWRGSVSYDLDALGLQLFIAYWPNMAPRRPV